MANPSEEGCRHEVYPNEPNNEDLRLAQCFICERPRKHLHGREVPLSASKSGTLEQLKSAAMEFNDLTVLEKISSFANESDIRFHKCCKDQYMRDIARNEDREFFIKKGIKHCLHYFEWNVGATHNNNKKECLFFNTVKKEYEELLIEETKLLSDSIKIAALSDRHLEKKTNGNFPSQD